jgi:hypothetical protein
LYTEPQIFEMISTFAIIAMLIGAVLGLRLPILILAPVILMLSGTVFGVGLALKYSLSFILIVTVFTILAVQIGYLAGSIAGFFIKSTRHKDSPFPIEVA